MLLRHLKEAWQERQRRRWRMRSFMNSIMREDGTECDWVLIVKVHPDIAPVGSANVNPGQIRVLVREYFELLQY